MTERHNKIYYTDKEITIRDMRRAVMMTIWYCIC